MFESPDARAQFMLDLLHALEMDGENKPIIVSPSMSGTYVMPLLFQHPEAFKGFVPVAPSVKDYDVDQFRACKVSFFVTFAVIFLVILAFSCVCLGLI